MTKPQPFVKISLKSKRKWDVMAFFVKLRCGNEEITKEEIDFVIEELKAIVDRLRSMSPLYEDFVKRMK